MIYLGSCPVWRSVIRYGLLAVVALGGALAHSAQALEESRGPARFEISLPKSTAAPIDGRLFLFLSRRSAAPMNGPDWFRPEPFFRLDVKNFKPGETRLIDDSANGFPDAASKLPAGKYYAQAVLDWDYYEPRPADGAGNLYSDALEVEIDSAGNVPDSESVERSADNGPAAAQNAHVHSLRLTHVVQATPFPESKWVKEIVLDSDVLARHHGRKVIEHAAVVLPEGYFEEPLRRYPVVYIIPGFGGSHRDGLRYARAPPKPEAGEAEFIRVYLSGRCKWGHHVYADSATNGPRGASLIREMIPRIDAEFRTVAEPTARFVMGHSSGGWSSLWLQVSYPEVFGGVWSSSPDPVDFRDFQQIDIYARTPLNMYRDAHGERRPIARRGETPVLWFDSFTKMDDVLGRGGQLRSFEAVFSPLDADSLPQRLWHRETGAIDPAVAEAWQKYDISLILKRDWARLEPLLASKIHLTMGTLDTFYLDGATRLLAERLRELGSDAKITMVEGANHGSVLTPAYFSQVRMEMSESFRKRHPMVSDAASGKD